MTINEARHVTSLRLSYAYSLVSGPCESYELRAIPLLTFNLCPALRVYGRDVAMDDFRGNGAPLGDPQKSVDCSRRNGAPASHQEPFIS